MVGTLSNREQRAGADAAELGVIPPRQRLGPAQPVIVERELRLEDDLDLVAIDRGEQIAFELGRSAAGADRLAIGPCQPAPLLPLGDLQRLAEPVEH